VKAALLAAMALSGLMVLTKLFTTVAWLADEPTVMLALRAAPSLSNELTVRDEAELRDLTILVTDENRFVGQGAYEAVTGGGWLVAFVVIAAGGAYLLVTRPATKRRSPSESRMPPG
jgi:hypothetical protein